MINASVTPEGMQEQLLISVIEIERPDIWQKRKEMDIHIQKNIFEIQTFEDQILQTIE